MKRLFTLGVAVVLCLATANVAFGTGKTEQGEQKAATTVSAQWSWEEAAAPYRGTKLQVVTVAWPEAVRQLADEFTARTGIEVEVTRLAQGPLYENTVMDLRTKTGAFDVFTINSPWLPGFVESGLLDPIEKFISDAKLTSPDYDFNDVLGLRTYSGYKGKAYGLSFGVSAEVLFYRKDLFDQYAQEFQSVYKRPLQPPESWAQYNEVAKFFTDTRWSAPDGTRGYGVAEHGKREYSLVYKFQDRVAGLIFRETGKSVGLIDENGGVTFDNQYGRLALSQWIEALHYAPPGVLEAGNSETKNLFAQGMTAMAVQFSSTFGDLSKSPMKDKYAVAMIPGGKSNTGCWALGVNPYARKPEAAYLLAQWLTTKDSDFAMFKLAGRYPSRRSTHARPDYKQANPFWEIEVKTKETGIPMLPHPEYPALEAILMEEISLALAGQKSVDSAVTDLAARFRKQIGQAK
jgi:multiple sugar transport system substrate-binding protein